jgi:hypothetical protein
MRAVANIRRLGDSRSPAALECLLIRLTLRFPPGGKTYEGDAAAVVPVDVAEAVPEADPEDWLVLSEAVVLAAANVLNGYGHWLTGTCGGLIRALSSCSPHGTEDSPTVRSSSGMR